MVSFFDVYLKQHEQYFAIGAVCDGIGGLENGELSSAMIIAEINSWMQSVSQWMDISVIDPKTLYSHLKDQAEIWQQMTAKPDLKMEGLRNI